MVNALLKLSTREREIRGESRTAATSKIEHFVIRVNGFQPLTIITIITKCSILDVAAVLNPPRDMYDEFLKRKNIKQTHQKK